MGIKGIGDLEKLKAKIDKLEKKDKYTMYDYLARQVALRFLSYVIPDTPVITGMLRRGWIGLKDEGDTPTYSEMKKFADRLVPERSGKRMSVTISNNVEYALVI